MPLTMMSFRESISGVSDRRRCSWFVFAVATLFACGAQAAEIYRWVDESGRVHFSDEAPEGRSVDTVELNIPDETGSFQVDVKREVVMYSKRNCSVCDQAREYFRKHDIPFREYDIETSLKGGRDYVALDGHGVPIILVGGQRMDGFSRDVFARLYSP